MCMVSNIYDSWKPYVPAQWPNQPLPVTAPPRPPVPVVPVTPAGMTPAQLQEFLDAFHKAVEAAKVFDRLTGQPDCEDPEKASLEARVAELEQKLKELTDGSP